MGRRLAGWIFVVAVSAAAAVSLSPAFVDDAVAGDPKVADSLFKSGKQALGKGDAEGAISFFKKAFEENPDLIEACWWRGSAQEKAGDKAGALASYREYVTYFEGKGPAASKEEQRLKALADKSIAQLAAGEAEFRKLEDGFVAALFAFAKENFVRDPGVSRKAVDALLAVRPEHDEAKKLLEKLGGGAEKTGEAAAAGSPAGPGASGPATGPFKDVKEWRDLLAEQTFKSDALRYDGGSLFFDSGNGKIVEPKNAIDPGNPFAYEVETRINDVKERGWIAGLGFACLGEGDTKTMLCGFFGESAVTLIRVFPGTRNPPIELAEYDMPPIDMKAWHRLGILVKGPMVEVWLDGKKAITWREPTGNDVKGELGIYAQRCTSEWRLFRVGSLP